jgi:hypothetical protein
LLENRARWDVMLYSSSLFIWSHLNLYNVQCISNQVMVILAQKWPKTLNYKITMHCSKIVWWAF